MRKPTDVQMTRSVSVLARDALGGMVNGGGRRRERISGVERGWDVNVRRGPLVVLEGGQLKTGGVCAGARSMTAPISHPFVQNPGGTYSLRMPSVPPPE
jgi:hypothetical protein